MNYRQHNQNPKDERITQEATLNTNIVEPAWAIDIESYTVRPQ